MPNPSRTDQAIRQGVAAHITAASPGGKRYDAALTPAQRSAVENGIWLCQACSRIIDTSEDAFPVAMLHAWKRLAEIKAARDARADIILVGQLLNRIDEAIEQSFQFEALWRESEPAIPLPQRRHMSPLHLPAEQEQARIARRREERYREQQREFQARIQHGEERKAAYGREIAPLFNSIVAQCEMIFGASDPLVMELRANVEFEQQLTTPHWRDTPDVVERVKLALSMR